MVLTPTHLKTPEYEKPEDMSDYPSQNNMEGIRYKLESPNDELQYHRRQGRIEMAKSNIIDSIPRIFHVRLYRIGF